MGLGFRRSSFEDQFSRQRLEPEPALVLSALGPFLAFLAASLALLLATPR
jgi:hypothetical protein